MSRQLETPNQAIKRLQRQVADLQAMFGRVGGGGWQTPTLLNSWSNFGSGEEAAGYRKETAGVVRLRGTITGGTTASGTALFVLPAGFRPAGKMRLPVTGSDGHGQVNVLADGTVEVGTAGTVGVSVSLAGLTFHADG